MSDITEWVDVPGFRNLYQACKEGEIKSLRGKHKPLQKYRTNGNAPFVALYKDGKRYQVAVNKIIYETFFSKVPYKSYVYPKDNNPMNNAADNLFLSTVKLK